METKINTFVKDDCSFALKIIDDSMTKEGIESYPIGCFIGVSDRIEPKAGDYVIFVKGKNEEASFRQLINDSGTFYLRPLNPQYEKIIYDKDIKIIGVVRQKIFFND